MTNFWKMFLDMQIYVYESQKELMKLNLSMKLINETKADLEQSDTNKGWSHCSLKQVYKIKQPHSAMIFT